MPRQKSTRSKSKTRKTKTKNQGFLQKLLSGEKSRILIVVAAFAIVGVAMAVYSSASTGSNYFNPGEPLSRQAAAAFMYRGANSPKVDNSKCGSGKTGPAKDVAGNHMFCQAIEWVMSKGIATAYADGTFRPTAPVSRQALAAFMYREAGSPSVSDSKCGSGKPGPFTDVKGNHQFCKDIEWLKSKGITSGYNDGTFRPTEVISRQVSAVMIHREAGAPNPSSSAQAFVDINSSHPYYKAIQWLGESKVSEGSKEPARPKTPNTSNTSQSGSSGSGGQSGSSGSQQASGSNNQNSGSSSNQAGNNGDAANNDPEAPDAGRLYFNPARETSRQAMAVFIARADSSYSMVGKPTECGTGKPGPFKDIPGNYVYCYVIDWAAQEGIISGYADGTFRPNLPVTRQAAAAFMYRLAKADEKSSKCEAGKPDIFTDVKSNHPFCNEIAWAHDKGILRGYEDKSFRPTASLTRQAAAVMLYRVAGSPEVELNGSFADVNEDHSFAKAIQWVSDNGISTGDAVKRGNYIDPLTDQELGKGASGDVVKNLQSRLIARGFDGVITVNGRYDDKMQKAVSFYQQARGLPVTGIFNCGPETCKVNRADHAKLVSDERAGYKFDAGAFIRFVESAEAARVQRESTNAPGRPAQNWDLLKGHKLCKGVNNMPDQVERIQWALSVMGYNTLANGKYSKVYDDLTVFNLNMWRVNNGFPMDGLGCFDSNLILDKFVASYNSGHKFNAGTFAAFTSPRPINCNNAADRFYNWETYCRTRWQDPNIASAWVAGQAIAQAAAHAAVQDVFGGQADSLAGQSSVHRTAVNAAVNAAAQTAANAAASGGTQASVNSAARAAARAAATAVYQRSGVSVPSVIRGGAQFVQVSGGTSAAANTASSAASRLVQTQQLTEAASNTVNGLFRR